MSASPQLPGRPGPRLLRHSMKAHHTPKRLSSSGVLAHQVGLARCFAHQEPVSRQKLNCFQPPSLGLVAQWKNGSTSHLELKSKDLSLERSMLPVLEAGPKSAPDRIPEHTYSESGSDSTGQLANNANVAETEQEKSTRVTHRPLYVYSTLMRVKYNCS